MKKLFKLQDYDIRVRILVTGSNGMLGSSIVRALGSYQQHEVFPFTRADGDLLQPSGISKTIQSFKPDIVVHTAAKVGGIQANIENPVSYLLENLKIDTNLISECLSLGVTRLLQIGSSCMYPRDFRQPLIESDLFQAPLEPTNEGYALAKLTSSKLCEFSSKSLGVAYKTIIPSNLYGPGDNFDPKSSHLVASVIRKVHEAKVKELTQIEVWGSGKARREFTYTEDLANWIAHNIELIGDFPFVMNTGFGSDYSVDEFYLTAMKVLGYEAELLHLTDKPEGMNAKLMDSSLAKQSFGWNPQTDLEEGMRKTLDWYTSKMPLEKGL